MRRGAVIAAAAGAALLTGCTAAAPVAGPSPAETVTVFAAASLRPAFDEIAVAFEAARPQARIAPISYDGSAVLAAQLVEGAPADVFASADERTMATVVDAGLAGEPTVFATNTLVLAMPAGNPAGIGSLADLADPAVTVVLCAAAVPCGAASQALLAGAGASVTPASEEQSVSAVLTKVLAGEADAGLVYATDVAGRDDVAVIVPPGADEVISRYPIAALRDGGPAASAFVEFVAGSEGRGILAAHGFGAP